MYKESNVDLEFIFKEAMDMTPDCFGIVNQEDIVIYCNNIFAGMFGLTKEEVIGRKNSELLRLAWTSRQGIIIDTDDFNQWYQNIERLHEKKSLNQFETDLTDGRWFKMTRVSMDSGYIHLFGVDITDLKKTQQSLEEANQQIETLANTDQLTGVNNRRSFDLIAEQEIKKSKRYQQPLSLLMMDLDFFKQINDNYGHEGGDYVLHEFACRCKKLIRQSDFLCRIGGEEFAVLLPMTGVIGAHKIAEKLRANLDEHDFYLDKLDSHLKLSVSIGISYLTDTEQSIKELLGQADMALYTAKRNGRNQVVEYSRPMPEKPA